MYQGLKTPGVEMRYKHWELLGETKALKPEEVQELKQIEMRFVLALNSNDCTLHLLKKIKDEEREKSEKASFANVLFCLFARTPDGPEIKSQMLRKHRNQQDDLHLAALNEKIQGLLQKGTIYMDYTMLEEASHLSTTRLDELKEVDQYFNDAYMNSGNASDKNRTILLIYNEKSSKVRKYKSTFEFIGLLKDMYLARIASNDEPEEPAVTTTTEESEPPTAPPADVNASLEPPHVREEVVTAPPPVIHEPEEPAVTTTEESELPTAPPADVDASLEPPHVREEDVVTAPPAIHEPEEPPVVTTTDPLERIFKEEVMKKYKPVPPHMLTTDKWVEYRKLCSIMNLHAPGKIKKKGPNNLKSKIEKWYKNHPSFEGLTIEKWCRRIKDPTSHNGTKVTKFCFAHIE